MPDKFELTPKQKAANQLLGSSATHILLRGGARSGKTFVIMRALLYRALLAPGSQHAVFRLRFNHLKHSIIYDTFPKVMRLCEPNVPYNLNRTDWYVEFFNGSRIIFAGLDQSDRTERILGTEFASVYENEASQISYSARNKALTRLAQRVMRIDGKPLALKEYADCNPPSMAHYTAKIWIKGVEPLSGAALEHPDDYATMQLNPHDNRVNISDDYIKQLETLPEKDRRRFLHGEFLSEIENALWTMDMLDRCRIAPRQVPDLRRIVVAIDPSGCEGPEDERSDEIGIVVAGLDHQGRGYVLEDLSGHYSPHGWASVALQAFDRHGADRIIAERNFGGAMVENTIKSVRRTAPVKMITASRGKSQRAEPIAALYEGRKVFHVGTFTDMEDQLLNFSTAGYQGDRSPDRGDAMVFALTELLLEGPKGVALVA